MCCCGKPIINGELGYKWQPTDAPRIRPVDPPALDEHDVLLYDEPGRCGGVDAHSHHYRIVKQFSSMYLMVQHGGGRERIRLHHTKHLMELLASLDTTQRYWLLHTIVYAYSDGKDEGAQKQRAYWQSAALEKRIKTRKMPNSDRVKLWVEPKIITEEVPC